jgi:hypothetical protein
LKQVGIAFELSMKLSIVLLSKDEIDLETGVYFNIELIYYYSPTTGQLGVEAWIGLDMFFFYLIASENILKLFFSITEGIITFS